jgi:hypothetical protein
VNDEEMEMEFVARLRLKRVFIFRRWLGERFLKIALRLMGARVIQQE